MIYRYFVSYSHPKETGNAEIRRSSAVDGIKDLVRIAKDIEVEKEIDGVVVMWFRLFGTA